MFEGALPHQQCDTITGLHRSPDFFLRSKAPLAPKDAVRNGLLWNGFLVECVLQSSDEPLWSFYGACGEFPGWYVQRHTTTCHSHAVELGLAPLHLQSLSSHPHITAALSYSHTPVQGRTHWQDGPVLSKPAALYASIFPNRSITPDHTFTSCKLPRSPVQGRALTGWL